MITKLKLECEYFLDIPEEMIKFSIKKDTRTCTVTKGEKEND